MWCLCDVHMVLTWKLGTHKGTNIPVDMQIHVPMAGNIECSHMGMYYSHIWMCVPMWEHSMFLNMCLHLVHFQATWKHLMSQLWNNTFPCLWTSNVPLWECQDKGMHGGIHYNHYIGLYHAHVHSMCSHCIFTCEHVMEKIGEVLCSLKECVVHINSLRTWWDLNGTCFWFLMCWRLLCE